LVIESTDFSPTPQAKVHVDPAGAKSLISAPAKGEGSTTIVLASTRTNQAISRFVNNGHAPHNNITPVLDVLERTFGSKKPC